MKAILLTAGEGTRDQAASASRPKPMLPTADRPLAAHTADAAIDAGADEIVLASSAMRVRRSGDFGEESRFLRAYAVQEAQDGTADAVDGSPRTHRRPLRTGTTYDPAAIDRLLGRVSGGLRRRGVGPPQLRRSETDGRHHDIVEKPDDPPTNPRKRRSPIPGGRPRKARARERTGERDHGRAHAGHRAVFGHADHTDRWWTGRPGNYSGQRVESRELEPGSTARSATRLTSRAGRGRSGSDGRPRRCDRGTGAPVGATVDPTRPSGARR